MANFDFIKIDVLFYKSAVVNNLNVSFLTK